MNSSDFDKDRWSCSNCPFWIPMEAGFGVCRGAPPTAVYDARLEIADLGQPVWPRTHGEDDWCGVVARLWVKEP